MIDPRVARFIARHHVSPREEVEADVAEHRGKSPEESWRDVVAVCRAAAEVLSWRADRDAVVAEVEPPHPSYHEVVRRLRTLRGRGSP